jgi:hypothetical protein
MFQYMTSKHLYRREEITPETPFIPSATLGKLTTSYIEYLQTKLNSVALVRKRTIPTERPPLVGEISANLCG